METLEVTNRIQSYENACQDQGITPLSIDGFGFLPEHERLTLFRRHQLMTIAKSLNEGWEPDFLNHDQYKYWVYVYVDAAGVACVYSDAAPTRATTTIGSRLCFKSRELAAYAARQFETLWIEMNLK